MNKHFFIVAALCASTALAQDVKQVSTGSNSPNINNANPVATQEVTVKSSPAEDTLLALAKQAQETAKTYDVLLQQARSNLDAKNKPILEEIKAKAKKWQDKIDADTKDLKAQMDKNAADAQAKFQQETSGLSSKAVPAQTITALEQIIRKEQNLPDTAHFDLQQYKWVDSAKK